MAVGMNDTNNNHLADPMICDGLGSLTKMLQNFRFGQTFGDINGYSSSNGCRGNEWNSDRNGSTNGYNGGDWRNLQSQRPAPGMRAIRNRQSPSFSDDDQHNTQAMPKDDTGKDWYHNYVEQTQRFAKWNGKPQKKWFQRHVHFENQNDANDDYNNNSLDDHYWDRRSDQTFQDNSFKSSNDFGFHDFGFKSNGSDSDNWRSDSLPKSGVKGSSIVDSLCHNILKPVADNFDHNSNYMRQQWNQNMAQIQTTLSNSSLFGNSIWGNANNDQNPIQRFFGLNPEDGKSKLAALFDSNRKAMPKTISPNYTWSGQLPRRIRTKTPVYSCKVFLGGIPYDLTDSDLHCTFAQFGHIQIQWPGKDIRSAIEGAAANKAGYVYIIFENYDNVSALLNSCTMSYRDYDSGCRWYYNISSRRQKSKEVQVIPFDIGDRFFMKTTFSGQMDHSRTVFVGALHGMLAADGLAKVMDDLFGGVIYAGLDTDKYKYPLGSGRVSFDNNESYLKAVSAAFIEIKSARFKKKIQIDPYIEGESQCVVCRQSVQNPIYCRDEGIYFCQKCWESHHSDPEAANHRPIIKNKSSKA